MNKHNYNKNAIICYIIFIVLTLFLYPILVFDSINKYNSVNFLFYEISLLITLFAFNDIKKNNINSYNVFLFVYFISLFFNTLNISTKQLYKTPEDLYIFLIGPLVLFIVLYCIEKIKYKRINYINILKFNPNTVYIILIIMYIGLKFYIGMKVGFRVYDYSDTSIIVSGSKYVIPGISGLGTITQWLLIIFIPYVKKKYVFFAILSIIIFSGIMNVKRGDIIRVLIFMMLYWVFIQHYLNRINKKMLIKLVTITFLFISVFVVFGEYRLEARGGASGEIIELLGSRIDSVVISWVYSYMSFNFEVLKLYYSFTPNYEMLHLYELFGANLERESKSLTVTISGFNAGTFIQQFMIDYGKLYYFELFVFSFIVSLIVIVSKKMNFIGLYIFLIMLMALLVFGDYILNRAIIMSIIMAIIIFPFLKIKKQKNSNENNN
jgi:oligosaccharide repeat unit polymerase